MGLRKEAEWDSLWHCRPVYQRLIMQIGCRGFIGVSALLSLFWERHSPFLWRSRLVCFVD